MSVRIPRVFRHANYRLFFFGQLVSLMGTWMQSVALGWLVYRLTNSPLLLGVAMFATQGPLLFLSPLGGALADRLDRRTIFVVTQSLSMLQAIVLTTLTLSGHIDITTLIALSLAFGIVNAVETPTRQAFTIEMVGREDLKQAIAINAMMFNVARTVGPALGGVIVAALGEGYCFLLNAFSYAAVLTSLLMMRLERRKAVVKSHPWDDLKQGFAYVIHHVEIRTAIILSTSTGFFGMCFLALMPAYTRDVLAQTSNEFGLVMSAFGIGAFAGAGIASRFHERHLIIVPTVMAVVFGTSLVLLASVHTLWPAIAAMLLTGASYLMLAVSNNTRLQIMSNDAVRGRVMSFYAMGALGCPPLGAVLLGFIAGRMGVPTALMFGGIACVAAAGLSWASLRRNGLLRSNEN